MADLRLPNTPPIDLTVESAAQWVFDTCRLFGASLSTSLLVAGTFVKPFENGHSRRTEPER